MDLTVTIYLLVAESIFFSALLVVCLKMASNKHHSHLKKLMELITKSEEKTKTVNAEKKSIEDTRKQLFDQITDLQNEIIDLKKTKQRYERLKIRYGELKNIYEKLKNKAEDETKNDSITITEESDIASSKIDSGINEYEKIISDLKETIKKLESKIENLNEENYLPAPEKRYEDIERSSEEDENTKLILDKLTEDLEYYKNRVFELEKNNNEESEDNNKYKMISKTINKNSLDDKYSDDCEELRKEIKSLRESLSDQRKIIFELEKEINQLKSEASKKELNDEQKTKKETETLSLERKLSETEGCIEILENEIQFLSEKLAALEQSKNKDTNIKIMEPNATVSPINIGKQIKNIISSRQNASTDGALELIATEILDAVGPSHIDVFLMIKSSLGEVEVSAKDDWITEDKLAIEERLNNDDFFSEINNNVLRMGAYHIVLLATPSNIETSGPITDYEDKLSTIILISNTIIDLLEVREKNTDKANEFKKVVDTVRSDAQKISIQQNYQTTESQRIIDTFLVDLNNSLNTMNITEHQSAFFDAMIQEARGRMDLLLSTRSSVESDFTTMIGKLEKNGGTLLH